MQIFFIVDGFTLVSSINAEQDGASNIRWQNRYHFEPGISLVDSAMVKNPFLKEAKSVLNFKQLWFRCYKPRGRIISIITVDNAIGWSVVDLVVKAVGINHAIDCSASCGSFIHTDEDNSRLGRQCGRWHAQKWCIVQHYTTNEVISGPFYIWAESHWLLNVNGRFECDDFVTPVYKNSYWKVYAR